MKYFILFTSVICISFLETFAQIPVTQNQQGNVADQGVLLASLNSVPNNEDSQSNKNVETVPIVDKSEVKEDDKSADLKNFFPNNGNNLFQFPQANIQVQFNSSQGNNDDDDDQNQFNFKPFFQQPQASIHVQFNASKGQQDEDDDDDDDDNDCGKGCNHNNYGGKGQGHGHGYDDDDDDDRNHGYGGKKSKTTGETDSSSDSAPKELSANLTRGGYYKHDAKPKQICKKLCENASGSRSYGYISDGCCWCGCQYYDCTAPPYTKPGKSQGAAYSLGTTPIVPPCCTNNSCNDLCGSNGGACDGDGNCICNCKPCEDWTPVTCPSSGSP